MPDLFEYTDNCRACGHGITQEQIEMWGGCCGSKCWAIENGEVPEPREYDPYDPINFEGFRVGE